MMANSGMSGLFGPVGTLQDAGAVAKTSAWRSYVKLLRTWGSNRIKKKSNVEYKLYPWVTFKFAIKNIDSAGHMSKEKRKPNVIH